MSDHLDPAVFSALIDNELSPVELALVNEHLAHCPTCTAGALSTSMLKQSAAQAGRTHTPSKEFLDRLASTSRRRAPATTPRKYWLGSAIAAGLVLAFIAAFATHRITRSQTAASVSRAALTSEVIDQHIAALASTVPPGVVSTDQHTVKPWFQGKLPFSFNLPANLPPDTVLEGANLTYVRNRPAAQLLYRIHKHRVSLFVTSGSAPSASFAQTISGFHVQSFTANGLDVLAVSDVNPADLSALAADFREAQQNGPPER